MLALHEPDARATCLRYYAKECHVLNMDGERQLADTEQAVLSVTHKMYLPTA